MTVVLDASALLAYLKGEPGEEVVDSVLTESVISSRTSNKTGAIINSDRAFSVLIALARGKN